MTASWGGRAAQLTLVLALSAVCLRENTPISAATARAETTSASSAAMTTGSKDRSITPAQNLRLNAAGPSSVQLRLGNLDRPKW